MTLPFPSQKLPVPARNRLSLSHFPLPARVSRSRAIIFLSLLSRDLVETSYSAMSSYLSSTCATNGSVKRCELVLTSLSAPILLQIPLRGSMLAVIITNRTFQHRTLLRHLHLRTRILPAHPIQLAQSFVIGLYLRRSARPV
jgi:hypothetical protein